MKLDTGLTVDSRAAVHRANTVFEIAKGALYGKADLREAAQEFESLLLEQMLRTMREAVPEASLMGHQRGETLFREMLDSEYMRLFSSRGGIGLADILVRHLRGNE